MPVPRRAAGTLSLFLLLLILAVAAGLRFWALDFGLPHPLARPDEKEILEPTFRFARGDLNPKYHVYPGLYLYLVWLWGAAGLAIRRWLVPTPPYQTVLLKDLQALPGGTGGGLLWIGRTLSALAGCATVLLVWAIGRRRRGEAVGLVAAALLATSYLHVRDSHALKAEALLTLAILPALAACARFAEQPTARRAAIAGAWIGVATGMKQPGILLLVPLYAAGVMGSAARGVRRLVPGSAVVLGGLVAVAVFLATGPYMVLDWSFVWNQMSPAIDTVFAPSGGAKQERALAYHVTMSLRHGTGLLFTLLAAPAVVFGLRSRDALLALASLFALLWFAVNGASPVHHVRYLTPILPLLCLLVASLLDRATARLAAPRAHLVLALLTLAVIAEPLASSIAHDRILSRTDTRVLASQWLAQHARPGDEVAVLGSAILRYGQPIMPPGVKPRDQRGEQELGQARFVLTHEHQLPFSRFPAADLERLRPRLHLEAEFSPYAGATPGGWFEAADAYYAPFTDLAAVLRPGPLIRIYTVRDPAPAAGG